MLLRLQVDGFKNLVNFDARFGPFNCIVGENGVGKSNIFDAIQFLSLIADRPLLEAARAIRSSQIDGIGEPEHLFTASDADQPMKFTAEIVVPRTVRDDFGKAIEPSITHLRYSIEIGRGGSLARARHSGLVVEKEELLHINRSDAPSHLRFPLSVENFRNEIIRGARRGGPFISTDLDEITVHQDGTSGRPRRLLPTGANTTVVSTINTADDPTILAARREMQSWQHLALEPRSLRTPGRFDDIGYLASDGQYLAATLDRIAWKDKHPEDVFARVAARLSGLTGVNCRSLRIDTDNRRELLSIIATDEHGRDLPARSLSDGTLRYLALCVLLEDPETTGLITMEEPENGIHPANLPEMVQLVKDLAVDPHLPPGSDNPLLQVIVNTHSPAVVQLVGQPDVLFASKHPATWNGRDLQALRLQGMRGTWRTSDEERGATKADLLPYLTDPPEALLSLSEVA